MNRIASILTPVTTGFNVCFTTHYGIVLLILASFYYIGIPNLDGHSLTAPKMGPRLLRGETVKSIPPIDRDSKGYVFNYTALQRIAIDLFKLPQGAEIIHSPTSKITFNRYIAWSFGILLTLLIIVVVLLLLSVRQKRKITKELKEIHIKLFTLIEHLPERVYMKDKDSNFLMINWINRSGFDAYKLPEDIVGKNDYDFFPRVLVEEFYREERRIITSGKPVINKEIKTRSDKGKEYWHHVSKIPYRNQAGKTAGIIGIVSDITGKKEEEKKLQKARESAKSANRAKSEFLAMMSHEIRTPMNSIMGFCQILETTALTKLQRNYLKKISKAGETLISLINDILDYSQIESGAVDIQKTAFSLEKSIGDTINSISLQAQRKGVKLDLNIAPDTPDIIIADIHRFKQILINLLDNAVKFTEKGKIKIHVLLERSISPTHQNPDTFDLVVSVEDTGVGIKSSLRDILFEPFSQADSSAKRHYGGTGLGLAICQKLLKQMGGSIDFSSQEFVGSKFTFYMPVQIASNEYEFKEKESSSTFEQALNSDFGKQFPLSILIVEDNEDNLFFISEILNKLGYGSEQVENGLLAVEKTRRSNWDLILMDVQMPEMDGLEATQIIRQEEQDRSTSDPAQINRSYIVALTAFVMQEDRQLCLQAGMNNFLSKPIRIPELLQVIQSAFHYRKKLIKNPGGK